MSKKDSPFNTKFNEATQEVQTLMQQTRHTLEKVEEPQNPKNEELHNGKSAELQSRKTAKGELNTDKISVYFSPSQTEKLALLALDYKRRTGKKIAPNEIVRRLVDKCKLDDILV